MVVEILIAEELLTKTPQVMDFIKDYDDLMQRKRIERAKKYSKSVKSTKVHAWEIEHFMNWRIHIPTDLYSRKESHIY